MHEGACETNELCSMHFGRHNRGVFPSDALVGRQLIRVCFDVGVHLDFDGPHSPELTIECPLRIGSWAGEPGSADAAARLLPLLYSSVAAADVDTAGDLALRIGVFEISVPADDKYEAWQLRRDDGLLIVSTPGGELAIWNSR
jgi:uncharacterized protein DUF6188